MKKLIVALFAGMLSVAYVGAIAGESKGDEKSSKDEAKKKKGEDKKKEKEAGPASNKKGADCSAPFFCPLFFWSAVTGVTCRTW